MCWLIVIILVIIILIVIIKSRNKHKEKFSVNKNCELPKYNPQNWNKTIHDIRKFNNCYSYALGDLKFDRGHKQQPGELVGKPLNSKKPYTCDDLIHAVQLDHPDSYIEDDPYKLCSCGYRKIFSAISPEADSDEDYHFYRQDNSLYWSHKPGSKLATNLDGSGNKIKNPLLADRNVDDYNYSVPCGFMCVKV